MLTVSRALSCEANAALDKDDRGTGNERELVRGACGDVNAVNLELVEGGDISPCVAVDRLSLEDLGLSLQISNKTS